MQYILIGHTRGDELVPSQRVILSKPHKDREFLEDILTGVLTVRRHQSEAMMQSTNGCYSELWAGSILSRCEVVPLEPGQAV